MEVLSLFVSALFRLVMGGDDADAHRPAEMEEGTCFDSVAAALRTRHPPPYSRQYLFDREELR